MGISLLTIFLLLFILLFLIDRFKVPILAKSVLDKNIISKKEFYKYFDAFNEDVRLLRPKLEFLNTKNTNDAGPFLNPRVEWDLGKEEIPAGVNEFFSKIPNSERLIVSDEIKKIFNNHKGSFMDIDPKQYSHVHTDWIHSLRKFDHWDIDKNSPLEFYPILDLSSPSLEFSPLFLFMRIHLLRVRGNSEKQQLEAMLDVLHFGKLCHSTETLIGEMVFVNMLGLVKASLKTNPKLAAQLGEWKPLIDERNRLRRMYWAIHVYTQPHFSSDFEIVKNVYNENGPTTGVCAAVREFTARGKPIWTAYTDVMPETMKQYQNLISTDSRGCRLAWVQKSAPWIKAPDDPESFYASEEGVITSGGQTTFFLRTISKLIHYFPETRKFLSSTFVGLNMPDYKRFYDTPLEE